MLNIEELSQKNDADDVTAQLQEIEFFRQRLSILGDKEVSFDEASQIWFSGGYNIISNTQEPAKA